jgi:hypothetical protein
MIRWRIRLCVRGARRHAQSGVTDIDFLYTESLRRRRSRAMTWEIVWFGGTPVAQLDGLTTPRALRYTFTDHLGTPAAPDKHCRRGRLARRIRSLWLGHRAARRNGRRSTASASGPGGGGRLRSVSERVPLVQGGVGKESGQSSRDICGMLNHWYNRFEDESCWKLFPRHGELAKDYLDKFCGGPGSCYGQHEEDPWWQKLDQWLAEQQKNAQQPGGAIGPPMLPPFEPVPVPVPVP